MESPLSSVDTEIAFDCLSRFVKWHLSLDQTELAPDTMGTYGKFLSLPMKVWLINDDIDYKELFDALVLEKIPLMPALLCSLGGQYMPPQLRERLLGPSRPDLKMPPLAFKRRNITLGTEYGMYNGGDGDDNAVEEDIIKSSIRGRIACSLQSFFFKFLCQRCELISTFNHPAAQSGLSKDHQLAVGVMREVLILPHFGSMYNFWMKHAEMIEDGGKLLELYWIRPIFAADIRSRISDDPDTSCMFQLCLDIGMSPASFGLSVKELCSRFDHP